MTSRKVTARALFMLLLAAGGGSACGGGASGPDGPLVVERTDQKAGSAVHNLAGSRWETPRELVEELVIGVRDGAEEYLLGVVSGLWVTAEHVYVVDRQVPVVRVYDRNGTWVRDIGREGRGPGEYRRPGDVVVLPDGTVALADRGNRRLVFFDAEGAPLRTWRLDGGFVLGLALLRDGTLLLRHTLPRSPEAPGDVTIPIAAVTPIDPATGQAVGGPRRPPMLGRRPEPLVVREGPTTIAFAGPFLFRPTHEWAVRPDGALVAGVGDEYRFEIHHPDGTVVVVRRYWEPVPVQPDEAAYAVRTVEGIVREGAPTWTYDGDPVPAHKPAFADLLADRDDRIWLHRPGVSRRVESCVEDPWTDPEGAELRPCWREPVIVDVFAPDGAYLGEVQRPANLTFRKIFVDGDRYWAGVEDEAGLATVRRFRLTRP